MNAIYISGIEYHLFSHLYAVARDGSVLRIKTQTIIQPKIRKDGYCNIASKFLHHRMVATCWVLRECEEDDQVHHIDENKRNNHADNLMWVSRKKHMMEIHDYYGKSGGYIRTEEHRQKLRDYRTGRPLSEETKAKQREAMFRNGHKPPARPLGFKVGFDTILKSREINWRNTACEINGIAYRSYSEAGRIPGMRSLTIRKRCLSENFHNYKVLKE